MTDRHQLYAGLFVLLATALLGVWQWSQMGALSGQVSALQSEAANLTSISKALAEDYQAIRVEVTAAREGSEQALALVFPQDEALTSLTRMFDDYAVKNNFESNPFFISSIHYGSEGESDDLGLYHFVSVSLSMESSKKNLSKFLEMIETSGSLEAGSRLMDIEGISIGYPSEYGGSFDVNLQLRAYYSGLL